MQAETRSQLYSNHDEILTRLARLDGAIKCANTRLLSFRPEKSQSLQPVDTSGAVTSGVGDFDDADTRNGVQTLKECISTAESVRDTFESSHNPDDISLMRSSDDSECGASGEEYGNNDRNDARVKDVQGVNGSSIDQHEFVGHHNPNHDEYIPVEVLSFLIEDLKEHAQKDLEAGHPKRAEVKLLEAVKYAEERKLKHGILPKDVVDVRETLAVVYKKQKKWAEARKILLGLLQGGDESQSAPLAEKALQHSRQYLLLATIHLEMYQAHSSTRTPQGAADLEAAERYAMLAFTKRFKHCRAILNQPDHDLLDSVKTLIVIHEAQGRTVLADSYYRQFIAPYIQTGLVPDELRRSGSVATGSHADVIERNDLLISAIRKGDRDHIESLLDTENANCRCSKGRTPLMYSVEQEDEVTIRKLLEHGAEINATTASGSTALHQAVVKGNVGMARLLIELDANIEATDKDLATPLLKAVEKNHRILVRYLLGEGASVHVKDKDGWTLLHHAAHNGAVGVLKDLLYPSHEVDVNATCLAGKSALHHCAELTLLEPARVLLDYKANVDALDANERSPLFFAVNKPSNDRREQFVAMLLENGARIDPISLPARQRDYPALQMYPASLTGTPLPSSPRRKSASTTASSGSNQTRRSFLRRFSLNNI